LLSVLPDKLKPRGVLERLSLAIHKRIEDMKARAKLQDESSEVETTHTPARATVDMPWREMQLDLNRHNMAADAWKAYLSDGYAAAAVDSIGDHATAADNEGHVFRMRRKEEQEPNPRAEAVIEQVERMIGRWRLERESPQILKRALIEGEAYREVVLTLNDESNIFSFPEIPGAREGFIMRKLLNKGTMQHVGWGLYNVRFATLVKTFAPWQVVQFAWNKFGHYGTPLIVSVRKNAERAGEQEDSMHTARQQNSYLRFIHVFDGVPTEQLKTLKEEFDAERSQDPEGVQTHYFTNQAITPVDPQNAQLKNLGDVQHNERKMMTGLRYPKGFFGGHGDNINRAVLEKQEENLIRLLTKGTAMLTDGFRELIDTQLILWNIIPSDIRYGLLWTDKSVSNIKDLADAMKTYEEAGLDPITALEEGGFDPEVVMARHQKWLEFKSRLKDEFEERSGREEEELARIAAGAPAQPATESVAELLASRGNGLEDLRQ
jgi:hypothetical protein